MGEHTCDGQWRYYCEACSGLPNDPDLIKEWKRDGSPFRLTPEEWETKREQVAEAMVEAEGFYQWPQASQLVRDAYLRNARVAMTALGFERVADGDS